MLVAFRVFFQFASIFAIFPQYTCCQTYRLSNFVDRFTFWYIIILFFQRSFNPFLSHFSLAFISLFFSNLFISFSLSESRCDFLHSFLLRCLFSCLFRSQSRSFFRLFYISIYLSIYVYFKCRPSPRYIAALFLSFVYLSFYRVLSPFSLFRIYLSGLSFICPSFPRSLSLFHASNSLLRSLRFCVFPSKKTGIDDA